MPIEIRELIIRARVDETQPNGQPGTGGQTGQLTLADREALVAACVEQVLQILADKKER